MHWLQPSTWIFWVHGANSTRFEKSFQSFAERIDLNDRSDPSKNILELVAQWLRNERNGRWLMILDNADDDSIYFASNSNRQDGREVARSSKYLPLSAYLPQSRNGRILVTSRDRRVALKLTGNGTESAIKIEPMISTTATALIQRKLSAHELGDADIPSFARMLDHIPLAITQACAYMVVEETTVLQYQTIFQENRSQQLHPLEVDKGDIHRDSEVSNAVVTTWQISFKQINAENPLAADILSLMAVLDRQGIPKTLLKLEDDSVKLNEALTRLRGFCLIKAERGGDIFEMHRLVQFALRAWLRGRSEMRKWTLKGLEILCQDFPRDAYFRADSWSQCSLLLPHTRAILDLEEKTVALELRAMVLLNLVGSYLDTRGHLDDAIDLHYQAYDIAETYLGPTDPTTLANRSNIAQTLSEQGKFAEAESIDRENLEQLLKTPSNVRDAEWDQLSMRIMGNLAANLQHLGKHSEAGQLQLHILGKKLEHGVDDEDTWLSMNAVASSLADDGKFEEAEPLSRKAIEKQTEELGQHNRHTLESMRTLVTILNEKNEFAEAEEVIHQVIDVEENLLAEGHQDRTRSAKLLANILCSQQRPFDAETVLREAQASANNFAKEPSLLNLNLKAELASALLAQGKNDEALALQIEALALRDDLLPSRDLTTYRLMSNLALTFGKMSKATEERLTCWQVLDGLVHSSSSDKVPMLIALLALARSMDIHPDLHDIFALCTEIMQAHQIQHPADWPIMEARVTTLSTILLQLGKSDSGLELAMRFRERSDLHTTQPVMALTQIHIRNNSRVGAGACLAELVADYTAVLGADHLVSVTHRDLLALYKDCNLDVVEELERKMGCIAGEEGDEVFPRSVLGVWMPVLLRDICRSVGERSAKLSLR